MVKILLFANLRLAAKNKEIDVRAEDVSEMMGSIKRNHRRVYDEIMDNGKIRPFVKILVNGRHIEFLQGMKTQLSDDDDVAIFPPVAGG